MNQHRPDVPVYHSADPPPAGQPPAEPPTMRGPVRSLSAGPATPAPPPGPTGPPGPPAGGGRRPRPFALADEKGVRAYGLLLPDSTAVTARWTDDDGVGALGVWSAPEVPARLWACALTWWD